jgi:cytidylate kinase
MEMRVAEIAKAHQVEKTEARKIIADADRERIAFIRRFYHQDPENPVHYDLTLNLGELSLATAQAIVLTALHKDFADAC